MSLPTRKLLCMSMVYTILRFEIRATLASLSSCFLVASNRGKKRLSPLTSDLVSVASELSLIALGFFCLRGGFAGGASVSLEVVSVMGSGKAGSPFMFTLLPTKYCSRPVATIHLN